MAEYRLNQQGQQVQTAIDKALALGPATSSSAGTMSAADKSKLDSMNPSNYQPVLVSGTNIKTVNNQSILGPGNIDAGGSVTVDSALSSTSTNPVQNKVINAALSGKQATLVGSGAGQNIKTINNQNILGSGNIDVQGGGSDPNAVKYTEQTLTDSQKGQARENIGAVGSSPVSPSESEINLYPTVNYTAQSLTSEQKAQARLNIGAGTSDFSGDYRDLSNKPTIPTVPATSTNINTDRNNNDKVAGTKAVYEEVHPKVETVRYSWGMSPNVFYNLGELTGNVVFLFAAPEDITIVNHYYFCFDTGATPPTVTWPVEITDWFGSVGPSMSPNRHYEVSVINGIATYLEV